MIHKQFNWPSGGSVSITFNGEGNGALTITSTKNTTNSTRSMDVILKTTDNSVTIKLHIIQQCFKSSDFGIDFNNDFCV